MRKTLIESLTLGPLTEPAPITGVIPAAENSEENRRTASSVKPLNTSGGMCNASKPGAAPISS